ncbi:MAG: aminopeptidase, partial [Nitrospinota bacterium]
MKTVHFRTIVLGLTALFLSSCGEFGYYFQAVKGEVSLLAKRKPISQLINAPDTPLKVKTRLELVERIRNFAIETLLLPKNGSYTSLVKVKT